jgi:hypothetical protein
MHSPRALRSRLQRCSDLRNSVAAAPRRSRLSSPPLRSLEVLPKPTPHCRRTPQRGADRRRIIPRSTPTADPPPFSHSPTQDVRHLQHGWFPESTAPDGLGRRFRRILDVPIALRRVRLPATVPTRTEDGRFRPGLADAYGIRTDTGSGGAVARPIAPRAVPSGYVAPARRNRRAHVRLLPGILP